MNTVEIGKVIAQARKEAGYTQKSLAECLFVTDKAVSKWERGICLPDVSLLSKLSVLLDLDFEHLISNPRQQNDHIWSGELRVENIRQTVAGKPLVHYLIAYFMLAGITDIAIITKDREYIRSLHLEKYGLNISFFEFNSDKRMVVYDKFILFGVNLTRQFQSCMSYENSVSLYLGDEKIPITFYNKDSDGDTEKSDIKKLARGTVYIPMRTSEEITDASGFVETYEKYHTTKISDLNEIAVLRGLK